MSLITAVACTVCAPYPVIPMGKRCRVCGRKGAPLPGHHCHARECSTAVKPELLMCFKHWNRVPRIIQRAVWAAYRPGQCDDKDPSESWHRAADAAIGAVALKEGRAISAAEREALIAHGFDPVSLGYGLVR